MDPSQKPKHLLLEARDIIAKMKAQIDDRIKRQQNEISQITTSLIILYKDEIKRKSKQNEFLQNVQKMPPQIDNQDTNSFDISSLYDDNDLIQSSSSNDESINSENSSESNGDSSGEEKFHDIF